MKIFELATAYSPEAELAITVGEAVLPILARESAASGKVIVHAAQALGEHFGWKRRDDLEAAHAAEADEAARLAAMTPEERAAYELDLQRQAAEAELAAKAAAVKTRKGK
jgi:hypothetical protein